MSGFVERSSAPDWDALLELAVAQAGLFTTSQASELGFSSELLIHHLKRGRLERLRRGIYRVRHLPRSDDEQLVEIWLWSACQGVFGFRTALALFDLSDVLPSRIDLIVPAVWSRRRLRVPDVVRLHYADLDESDRTWIGHVPVTTVFRTLTGCVAAGLDPALVEQAVDQALERGRLLEREARALRARAGT